MPMNPATALASVLVDELLRCGLSDAVVAPGSRSAPLAMAFAEHGGHGAGAGTGNPAVRLHVRIDERSAGYLAVGLGKASGRPAAVVCTSGTAAANLHPAVVEASHAGVPLIVLTADRPPELRDTGSNQTIDQLKLYQGAVRWFCEVGAPEARAGMVAYWRSIASRAWSLANAPGDPGPVHLNAAFREPLVPDGHRDWPEALDGRPGGAPWTEAWKAPEPHTPAAPAATVASERGVLVVGDTTEDAGRYVAAAEAAGWPVFAEPSSNARRGECAIATYHHLLGAGEFVAAHRPDAVVTVGKPGLSRPLLALLGDVSRHVAVDACPRGSDPRRSAAARVPVQARLELSPSEPGWLRAWQRADAVARRAVDEVLDADDRPTEPRLARDLAAAVPDGALLVVGSSMPVRDLDQTMRPRAGLRVLANRGASGIDGSVSTAVGAALAHGGPSFALLGDLAFLHDQNGLVLGADEPRPDLLVVVVNNDGGGIFSLLPQAGHVASFERVFGTPHGIDLSHLAGAYGIRYRTLARMGELPAALTGNGLRLLEVRTDRTANARLHHDLRDAVAAALRAAGMTGPAPPRAGG